MTVTEELLPVAFTFMLYGSFLISAAFALYTLFQRPVKTRETWALFALILTMIILSTVGAGFQYTKQFHVLEDKIAFGPQSNRPLEGMAYKAHVVAFVIQLLNLLIGDSVLVWRCFKICPEKRIGNIIAACLVGTAVLLAIIQRILVVFEKNIPGMTFYYVYWFLILLGCIILLISNLVTTGFMSSKARKYFLQLKLSHLKRSGSRPLSVLLLLIECGALYAIFQTLTLVNLIMVATASEPSGNFDAVPSTAKHTLGVTIFGIIVDSTFMMLSANITTLTIALTALSKKDDEDRVIAFENTEHLTSFDADKREQSSV
ncbi:hypothetical protein DL96DRAFT_1550991 [Flagelloscypha sp. PMI_526]|nr:hypothetical protein DL96DRAFT_1550991 [Flagelloscypha sp. PMI_526]